MFFVVRPLALLAVVLLSFSTLSHAIDPTTSYYQILSGDLNADQQPDFLIKGLPQFVPIRHRQIMIPLIKEHPSLVLQSNESGQFDVLTQVSEVITNSAIWQPSDVPTFAANLNNDAYGDLVLLTANETHRGVVLYGTADQSIGIGAYLDASFIGETAFNTFENLSLVDVNKNGSEDLVFTAAGETLAIAYSQGQNFNVSQAADPFTVTSQWQYLEASNQDAFAPVTANSAGFSINRMETFNVNERPLVISNFAGAVWTSEGEVQRDAAKTIVIIANSMNLTQPIQVLGAKADLLLITEDPSGNLVCVNCSFEGVYRVSMVTLGTDAPLNANTDDLGTFLPGPNTSAYIKAFKAPSAIGLDILTQNLNDNPGIDLTQAVTVREDGLASTDDAVVADENGAFTLSSGTINLLLGNIEWGYHDNQIKSAAAAALNTKTIAGRLKAKSIRISSTDHLVVNTDANTMTEFASAVSYRGSIFLPEESVDYQSLGGDLSVQGLINSEGSVRYKAKSELTIETDYLTQQGDHLVLVSGSDIHIPAGKTLVGNQIEIAAQRVINSGSIQAAEALSIASETDIINQYGGELFGQAIRLDAQGIVRNGSLTTYRYTPSQTYPLNASTDLISTTKNLKTELGTYYRIPLMAHGSAPNEPLPTQRAHIVGSNISIQAQAFENINPIQIDTEDALLLGLQRSAISDVSVNAEQTLEIKAQDYIVNTSALISVDQSVGSLKLQAPAVINERYQLVSKLDYSTQTQHNENGTTSTDEVLETITEILSPPGIIRSAGTVAANAENYFLNNAGYLEAFNSIEIVSPKLISQGYQHQGITKNESTVLVKQAAKGIGWIEFHSAPEVYLALAPLQLDSLLYAGAGLKATDSDANLSVVTLIDPQIQATFQDIIYNNHAWVLTDSETTETRVELGDHAGQACNASVCRPRFQEYKTTDNYSDYRVQNVDFSNPLTLDLLKQANALNVIVERDKNTVVDLYEVSQGHCGPLGGCGYYDRVLIQKDFSITDEVVTHSNTLYPLFEELKKRYDNLESTL